MANRIENFSRPQMARIATEYAVSEETFSEDYFCKKYEIASPGVFYRILKKAIRESMVSLDIAQKMADKSADNAFLFGGMGGRIRTVRAYQNCMNERKDFNFTINNSKHYMRALASFTGSVQDFQQVHCIERALLERTIERTFQNMWVDSRIMHAVEQKYKAAYGNDPQAIDFDKIYAEISKKVKSTKKQEVPEVTTSKPYSYPKFHQLSFEDILNGQT